MKKHLALYLSMLFMVLLPSGTVLADEFSDTYSIFRDVPVSEAFFGDCYGYAIFPTIGKGGFVVGAAHGDGRVYQQSVYVGDTIMNQLTVGLQLGGQAFSQIIFFENEHAFTEYTSGEFEFGAQATAVAITAAAHATTSTAGTSAGASSSSDHASNAGVYNNGMTIFTVAKGGMMFEASLGGQKFKYTSLPAK